jgi:hypothetical protein
MFKVNLEKELIKIKDSKVAVTEELLIKEAKALLENNAKEDLDMLKRSGLYKKH